MSADQAKLSPNAVSPAGPRTGVPRVLTVSYRGGNWRDPIGHSRLRDDPRQTDEGDQTAEQEDNGTGKIQPGLIEPEHRHNGTADDAKDGGAIGEQLVAIVDIGSAGKGFAHDVFQMVAAIPEAGKYQKAKCTHGDVGDAGRRRGRVGLHRADIKTEQPLDTGL